MTKPASENFPGRGWFLAVLSFGCWVISGIGMYDKSPIGSLFWVTPYCAFLLAAIPLTIIGVIAGLAQAGSEHPATQRYGLRKLGAAGLGILLFCTLEHLGMRRALAQDAAARIAIQRVRDRRTTVPEPKFESHSVTLNNSGGVTPGPPAVTLLPDGTPLVLMPIPAGTFLMGSRRHLFGRTAKSSERPAHKVTITQAFWLGKFPVTRAQWTAVTGEAPPAYAHPGTKFPPDTPVDFVNWADLRRFLDRLNGLQRDWTFRLPTEAEWEYACRAGTVEDAYGPLGAIAWYRDNVYLPQYPPADPRLFPVGGKLPNAFGLYDMLGNAKEWTQDWWAGYPHGQVRDPQGPPEALPRHGEKVVRGGTVQAGRDDCLAVIRGSLTPETAEPMVGFRVVGMRR